MSASAGALPPACAEAGGAGQRRRRWRPGLFDLYLIRGVAGPFLAILLAVGMAMMLERSLRLIHEMAASGAHISYFLPLLGQLVPYYLDLALPAAFMAAMMLLVARLDERLELEAMLASGLSLARIAAPLVALGVLIAGLDLAASGWLEPLGRYHYRAIRIEAINAGRIARLEPRAVYHPSESLAVTFDRRGEDGAVRGIFVWQRLADGRELVLTGDAGRIGFSSRRRLFGIDLDAGRYLAQRPPAAPWLVEFDQLALREPLTLRDSIWARGWDRNEMTLPELFAARRHGAADLPQRKIEAELYSRVARAAILPLLPLLVLPLAFATKKGHRGLGLLVCGTLLMACHHGINLARSLAISGAADPGIAIPAAAAACAALALLVFLSGRHLPSHGPIHALLKPLGQALSRLALRERAMPSLGGRTIATYLAWQLGKWILLALLAIVALLQMVDLFEQGDEFVARGFSLGDVGRYAWLRLPPMVQQAIPIAALAGAMATFAGLGRRREMTAIRAAGVSQWRILTMATPVPLLLSLASLVLAERVTPASQVRFAAWWSATESPAREAEPPAARWFRIGGEIVRAGGASADGRRLGPVEIFRRSGQGRLEERIRAERAVRDAAGWTLEKVAVTRIENGAVVAEEAARLAWATPLAPGDVAAFFAETPMLSSAAARRALDATAPVGQPATLFATRLHRSVAAPLAPLLMLMLTLPLAFLSPRTSTAWPAWLYAAGGGTLYVVADGVLTVAAQVGYLPAAVGAWAAPAIVALTGVTVLLYSER